MNEDNNIYVGNNNPNQGQEVVQQYQPEVSGGSTKSSKKIILFLVIIIVIIVLGFGALYFFVFNKTSVSTYAINGNKISIANTPNTVEAQFINDLILANYKGAYALTSSKFQTSQPLSIFIPSTKFLNVKQLQLQDLKKSSVKGVVVESGQLAIQNHPLFVFSSRMVKDNFVWKVDDLVIH